MRSGLQCAQIGDTPGRSGRRRCSEAQATRATNRMSSPAGATRGAPLSTDIRTSRGAGQIFRHHRKIFRPSQDYSEYCGRRFTLNEIIALERDRYEETRRHGRPELDTGADWNTYIQSAGGDRGHRWMRDSCSSARVRPASVLAGRKFSLRRIDLLTAAFRAIRTLACSSIQPTDFDVIWIRMGKVPSLCNSYILKLRLLRPERSGTMTVVYY
jgi:hypothetical protein